MAAPTGTGRVGNLTPEQDATLKETWQALYSILGIEGAGNSQLAAAPTSGDLDKSDKAGKKAKEGNDKYGQTKEFQQALAQQSPAELREAFWEFVKLETPDTLLLRFLRARSFDVRNALIMLISTIRWRVKEVQIDSDIMLQGEEGAIKGTGTLAKKDADDFIKQIREGKSFLHGTDKDGRICCYIRVKLHKIGGVTGKSLERLIAYWIETARLFLQPPVDTATIVFDMTDFSLANMDYTPVKYIIKCLEANYPESLGAIIIYKAPWIFNGIWKLIRGWLDPVVAAKVHFAANVKELAQTMGSESNIMKELGGTQDFEYTYVEPKAGENDALKDTIGKEKVLVERRELEKQFEAETIKWLNSGEKGTGASRDELGKKLQDNYRELDPYVRARSLIDRTQSLKFGGGAPSGANLQATRSNAEQAALAADGQ